MQAQGVSMRKVSKKFIAEEIYLRGIGRRMVYKVIRFPRD